MRPDQVAALQALAHWSEWLVTVGIALLAAIASINKGILMQPAKPGLLWYSALCFVVAIVTATAVLGAVPDAMQKVPLGVKKNEGLTGTRDTAQEVEHTEVNPSANAEPAVRGATAATPEAGLPQSLVVDQTPWFFHGIYAYKYIDLIPLGFICAIQHIAFALGLVLLVVATTEERKRTRAGRLPARFRRKTRGSR